jgi:hypothetical protein
MSHGVASLKKMIYRPTRQTFCVVDLLSTKAKRI